MSKWSDGFFKGMFYKLDKDGNVQECSIEESEDQFRSGNNRLFRTEFPDYDIFVSTVFLIFNHNIGGGTPILFETMIFCASDIGINNRMYRYATLVEARIGHFEAIELVVQTLNEMGFDVKITGNTATVTESGEIILSELPKSI